MHQVICYAHWDAKKFRLFALSLNKAVLVERWKAAKQYKHYRLWRMKTGAIQAMSALLNGAPIVRVLDAMWGQ